MREKHKFYLDEICPSNGRKPFQDISKAVQATKIILLIEKKPSRRNIDQNIVSLLKPDCKCGRAKKLAELTQTILEMGNRRNKMLTDFACHLFEFYR